MIRIRRNHIGSWWGFLPSWRPFPFQLRKVKRNLFALSLSFFLCFFFEIVILSADLSAAAAAAVGFVVVVVVCSFGQFHCSNFSNCNVSS